MAYARLYRDELRCPVASGGKKEAPRMETNMSSNRDYRQVASTRSLWMVYWLLFILCFPVGWLVDKTDHSSISMTFWVFAAIAAIGACIGYRKRIKPSKMLWAGFLVVGCVLLVVHWDGWDKLFHPNLWTVVMWIVGLCEGMVWGSLFSRKKE